MNILDIIEVKKRGGELTDAQIDQFVDATIDPATPDYQLAALLMAIRINGMHRPRDRAPDHRYGAFGRYA